MSTYVICDTEGSGLQTSIAEMYSFGGFLVDANANGLLDLVNAKAIHRFFNTDKPVPADSFAVHGLSNDILFKESHGDYLEDCYHELDDYIYNPDAFLVGYNVSFDRDIITNNLLRNGLEAPRWKKSIDVMQEQKCLLGNTGYYGSRIKLIKAKYLILNKRCNCNDDTLKNVFSVLCKKNNIDCGPAMFHSALWDSFITMLIFNEVKRYQLK